MNTSCLPLKTEESKINIVGLDRAAMQDLLIRLGEKPFRAHQIIKWIHQMQVDDFSVMTNLSKVLRLKLAQHTYIAYPPVIWEKVAKDGTHKWLIKMTGGNSVEMVFIPEINRGTLCVSSQIGCALDCSFCATGKQGFNRNLSTAEIIAQLHIALRRLKTTTLAYFSTQITNIVFMGMGEPLLNFEQVLPALNLMLDPMAYGLSKYRVTVSTSGFIETMLKLKAASPVALAVSLHAPNNQLRNQLVPLNKKYPLEMLIPICRDYYQGQHKRMVTFEYVMLKDVNDTNTHAKELADLLKDVPCKVNLIPYNHFSFSHYECSSAETIFLFQKLLKSHHPKLIVTIRWPRGDDIDAACGQLVGKFQDLVLRRARWLKINTNSPVTD